jgi:hypothetical protein
MRSVIVQRERQTPPLKRCPACRNELPRDLRFFWHNNSGDGSKGWRPLCRMCTEIKMLLRKTVTQVAD